MVQLSDVNQYMCAGSTAAHGATAACSCGALLATRGDGSLAVHEGQFVADEFVGSDNGFEGGGGACSAADARAAAAAADAAAATARAYEVCQSLVHTVNLCTRRNALQLP